MLVFKVSQRATAHLTSYATNLSRDSPRIRGNTNVPILSQKAYSTGHTSWRSMPVAPRSAHRTLLNHRQTFPQRRVNPAPSHTRWGFPREYVATRVVSHRSARPYRSCGRVTTTLATSCDARGATYATSFSCARCANAQVLDSGRRVNPARRRRLRCRRRQRCRRRADASARRLAPSPRWDLSRSSIG